MPPAAAKPTDAVLERETTELLSRLIRFRTVNPPGDERRAIEHLEAYLRAAGFATELLAPEPERPNLVATLSSAATDAGGEPDGPVLGYLGHLDTVLADPRDWRLDPWGGEVVDGVLHGRGAIDMKSQVAAEAAAAATLARSGWRPATGALRLMFVVDEETGGELGAKWLTAEHPDRARCDMVINEGAGAVFEHGGHRHYGVCIGEKGVFRFTLAATGAAGHASMPAMGDNALVKLVPVLERLARARTGFDVVAELEPLLAVLGGDVRDPAPAASALRSANPELAALLEPMLGVTLAPTMASASQKINVIPARAEIKVDCRVPPGRDETQARRLIAEVLGDLPEGVSLRFDETVSGNLSPTETPLMESITRWVERCDPGARAVPVLLPGFSDSRWWRSAFPGCVAYGFFPQRHMSWPQAFALMHAADERIDVRDLAVAASCYRDLTLSLLG